MQNTMKKLISIHIVLIVCYLLLTGSSVKSAIGQDATQDRPNIIIILTDDQGYGDLASYGNSNLKTPHTDRMASEGMKFTDFYVPASVCTPTRAALLTGSYPKRISLGHRVLNPLSYTGLNPDEITIADMLKKEGYATALIGKWHLGHHPPFLPRRQGFDYFFGIPYSNDMGNHQYSDGIAPPLPVMRNEEIIEINPDQNFFTSRFTVETLNFITEHRTEPFFLYLAHALPHVPIASSYRFQGNSEYGLYGDVIEEIDWSVGQILDHLEELGIDDNTIIFFTSDNGAQIWEGEGGWVWTPDDDGRPQRGDITYQSGTNSPLRGAKNSTWEGGMRVPFLIHWPGQIPAGKVSNELTTAMDFFPTLAGIVGADISDDRIIDGYDIWPILSGDPAARSPYDAFYYYRDDRLQAVRSGNWKLHVYRPEEGSVRLLYNLETDIGESDDVSEYHPEVVERLEELADNARKDLGDAVTGQQGENIRPVGEL